MLQMRKGVHTHLTRRESIVRRLNSRIPILNQCVPLTVPEALIVRKSLKNALVLGETTFESRGRRHHRSKIRLSACLAGLACSVLLSSALPPKLLGRTLRLTESRLPTKQQALGRRRCLV